MLFSFNLSGMKRFWFIWLFLPVLTAQAQRGKLRIAYIDMEMILDSMPEYRQAMDELNLRVVQWKNKMEEMRREIDRLKKELEAEKLMLTEDLYKEKMEVIEFKEKQLNKYQMEKFGPQGDLVIQRMMILKPVQDQVFNTVQKIAQTRHFDVVFDKSSKEAGVVYIDGKLDITPLVIRELKKQHRAMERQKAKQRKTRKKKEVNLQEKYRERRKRLEAERKAREARKAAEGEPGSQPDEEQKEKQPQVVPVPSH